MYLLALLFIEKTGPIERSLGKWQPAAIDRRAPDSRIWVKDAKIAGLWTRWSDFDGCSYEFTSKGNHRYAVRIYTKGCVDSWELKRSASYENGIIQFDKPVQVYTSETFDRLYPVKSHGLLLLAPPRAVAEKGPKLGYSLGTVGKVR
jgi:hypothetical protein